LYYTTEFTEKNYILKEILVPKEECGDDTKICAIFKAFAVVMFQVEVFWVLTPFPKMGATWTSETLVSYQQHYPASQPRRSQFVPTFTRGIKKFPV
jgi:hypothetical protein